MRRLAGSLAIGVVLATCALPVPVAAQEEAPPAPTAAAAAAPAVMEVTYENNLLSVTAERADLAALLKRISEATGIAVEIGSDVKGTVSLSFSALNLEEGINRILDVADSKNYAATFERVGEGEKDFRLQKISVVKKGKGDAQPAESAVIERDWPRSSEDARQHLKKMYGTSWIVRWDESRGRVAFFRGDASALAPRFEEEGARRAAIQMLKENERLLGIQTADLRLAAVNVYLADYSFEFRQVFDGVPVDGGRSFVAVARLPEKSVLSVDNQTFPGINISTEPQLTADEAVKLAGAAQRSDFGAGEYARLAVSDIATRAPELLIYPKPEPEDRPTTYRYHLVWKVHFDRMTYYVDARTGEVVLKGGNVAYDTLEGTVTAKRWGNGPISSAGKYVDDLSQQTNGLVGLTVRDGNLLPVAVTDAEGHYRFEGSGPVSVWLESTVRSDPPSGFAVYTGFSEGGSWPRLVWSSADAVNGEFPDGVDTGHQGNVYHQMERGLVWLLTSDGYANNEPPMLSVHAAVPPGDMSKSENLGETNGSSYIKLTSEGGTTSDVILHELMHTAAFTVRGNWISAPYVYEHAAVDEGLATYFAMRANDDSDFDTYNDHRFINVALDPQGYEPSSIDRNEDGVISHLDWQHYKSGDVMASILWDLTKEAPTGVADADIWRAVREVGGFRPEDFYAKLGDIAPSTVSLLWPAFSAHGVNLRAEPYRVIGGALAGASVNWFEYFGFSQGESYEIERREVGSSAPSVVMTSTTSEVDDQTVEISQPPKTYLYRARPTGNDVPNGMWSNWAWVTVGDAQAAHIEIKSLDVVYDPTGQSATSDGEVSVRWAKVGTLSGVLGYKIEWTAAGEIPGKHLQWNLQGTQYDTAYTIPGLKNGVEYTVRVVAIDDAGTEREVGLADTRKVTAVNNIPPPAPSGAQQSTDEPPPPSDLYMKLWDWSTEPDVVKFLIHYQRDQATGAYDGTGLKYCCRSDVCTSSDFVAADSPIDVGDHRSCVFRISQEATYYLAIQAIDNSGNRSDLSQPYVYWPPLEKPESLYGIVLLHPETHRDAIALSWSGSTDNDFVDHYLIERSFNGGAFAQLDLVNAADGQSRHDPCACNEGGLLGDGRYLYIDSFNDLDCGGLSAGTYRYLIYAVDGAGNRSVAAEYTKVLDPLDLLLVVARSSRWVHFPTSYPRMVRKLVGALSEKVPDGSNVGVILFQKDVVTAAEAPAWHATFPEDSEAHRMQVAEQVDAMLAVEECASKLTDAERDQCWRKDYWFLDLSEALAGLGEGAWRDAELGIPAPEGWNARRLREWFQTGHRKIAILIGDWYDNHLIGHLNEGEVQQVYGRWGDALQEYTSGGNILKNVILHRASTPQAWMADPGRYFADVLHTAKETFVGPARIREDDLRAMTYQDGEAFDNKVLDELIHCRENFVNDVYRIGPGERRRIKVAVDSSVSSLGILLFGAGVEHRLYRPDGTEVPIGTVGGVARSLDPQVAYQRLANAGYDRFGLRDPEPGVWTVEVDGRGLSAPVWGQALGYGTTGLRLSAQAPALVRPGEVFSIGAMVSGAMYEGEPPSALFRLVRPGSVYEAGSKNREMVLAELPVSGSLVRFGRETSIVDYEGRYPYRFLMKGRDAQGYEVSREVSGSLFVKGDAPMIAALSPVGEIVAESPLVTAVVGDDVKVQSYTVRVDGRSVPVVAEDVSGATPALIVPPPGAGGDGSLRRRLGPGYHG